MIQFIADYCIISVCGGNQAASDKVADYAFNKLSDKINKNQDLNQKIIAIKDLIYKE